MVLYRNISVMGFFRRNPLSVQEIVEFVGSRIPSFFIHIQKFDAHVLSPVPVAHPEIGMVNGGFVVRCATASITLNISWIFFHRQFFHAYHFQAGETEFLNDFSGKAVNSVTTEWILLDHRRKVYRIENRIS